MGAGGAGGGGEMPRECGGSAGGMQGEGAAGQDVLVGVVQRDGG